MREIIHEYLNFIVAMIAFLMLLGFIYIALPYFKEISVDFIYALTGVSSG